MDIEKLQTDITAKLNSEEYFASIPVYSVRELQIQSEIEQAMPYLLGKNNKVGIGVLVGMPTFVSEAPNLPGPQLTPVLGIRVQENPIINMDATSGTLKSAEAVTLEIIQMLHQFQIEGLAAIYADKKAAEPNTEFEGLVTYDIFLNVNMPQSARAKVIIPEISDNALTVTLTNNTTGATIYYTTNGTFPGSGNSAAVVYAAPFAVLSGTTVRFAAYKTGMQGSDVGQGVIT